MNDALWQYVAGVAGDGLSFQRNQAAFDEFKLLPRVLRAAKVDCSLTLFNEPLAAPIMLAPLALQCLAHPDGELASAAAAMAQDLGFVLSTLSSCPMAEVARAACGAALPAKRPPLWFQLYLQPRWQDSLSLIRRAEDCGFSALVVTVDAPVTGLRLSELRTGFSLPANVSAVELEGMQPAPTTLDGLLACAPDWRSIEALRSESSLPIILKGILSPADAALAKAVGVDGIIVSNHGGRVLDGVPATIECLSAVRAAVGPEMTVMLDGGIRRGSDIAKAVCLGADCVLLGRPLMQALALDGALGVARMLKILKDELAMVMALLGASSLKELNRDCLWGK
nr:alpha-hydroxy acid oxidase [Shewanella jiangmenensis]